MTPWIGPAGQRMARLELHITYTCPERCVFCSEAHRMASFRPFLVTWARVATVLRTHAQRGVQQVHLTGGEPTIHPQFVRILRLAKKLGMRTSVGSIGTMLSRPAFADLAWPHLDEALFSLHGPDAATHDALTRVDGSFDRVTKAIRLARRRSPAVGVYVNSVITRHNVDQLPDTAALVSDLGATLMVVSNTTPEGAAYDAYPDLAVPLADLARILPQVPDRAPGVVVRFFGVPMCILGDHAMLSNDLHWDPRVTVEWAQHEGRVSLDGIYNWAPDRKRTHVDACDGCSVASLCMGVYDRYAALWPTDALQPR